MQNKKEVINNFIEQALESKDTMAVIFSINKDKAGKNYEKKLAFLRHSGDKDLVNIERDGRVEFSGTLDEYGKYLRTEDGTGDLIVEGQAFSNKNGDDKELAKKMVERYRDTIRLSKVSETIAGKMVNEGREPKRGRGFGKK